MKAENEGEALQHMAAQFEAGGGLLSGSNANWTMTKVRALKAMDLHARQVHGRPIMSLLDIGVGDMRYLEAWNRFGDVYYMGVDGCPEVVEAAKQRHTDRLFIQLPFSQLVTEGIMDVMPPDAVLLLDVLYHIPDPDLDAALRYYVYRSPAEYIILSHATDPNQKFDQATGVGGPGFCWFPRPWYRPRGWDIIHQEDSTGAPQEQRLVVLARSS